MGHHEAKLPIDYQSHVVSLDIYLPNRQARLKYRRRFHVKDFSGRSQISIRRGPAPCGTSFGT
jgi:hypothetical protein